MAIRPQLAILFAAAAVFGLLGLRRNWRGVIAGAAALAVVLAGVVVHNSIATGHRTGLSGNSGDVFFHGQCHARDLVVVDPRDGGFIHTTSTVETQHTRGRDYAFRTESPNLERFLFHRGLDCIRDHGFGQLRYWGENVLDGLSATTPWPQVVASDWTRNAARIANNAYTWMLCLLVAAAVVVIVRRRRRGEPVRTLLFLLPATLLWVPLAIVFFGAPRYRQPFDLFAFGLFAALLTTRPARVRD